VVNRGCGGGREGGRGGGGGWRRMCLEGLGTEM